VSMATGAAARLWPMTANTRVIVAIEWLAACQGIDFHGGLRTTEALEQMRQRVRQRVPHYDRDRFFAPDIEAATELVARHPGHDLLPDDLLPSLARERNDE
ncbi:MAG: aromatic amino acid lyase, partial [Actinomycetota bacterium]|nr:aromatic amino acid lyase [Actinomycetota bacterium]